MSNMEFTYNEYKKILLNLKENNYTFTNYLNSGQKREVILRHDVDVDVEKAVSLAELENKENVKSTYFILLSSNLYNVMDGFTRKGILKIHDLGHDIGLHFDETKHENQNIYEEVLKEKYLFESLMNNEIKINSVSMHIPSKQTLEADYTFEDKIVNSYSRKFFKEYKYISDSNMNWRENPFEVIKSNAFDKIHLLTHPIWYDAEKISKLGKIQNFYDKKNNSIKTEIELIAPGMNMGAK